MKNLIKIGILGAFVLLGLNQVTAQELSKDQNRPEVIAKAEIEKVDAKLNLSDEQERALFRAYVGKIVSYRKSVDGKDASSTAVAAAKDKIDTNFNAAVKKVLGDDKYKAWLAMQ